MRLVIVTGMSGAGKTTTLKMLEDMGYFCVDNLPIPLLPRFVEMFDAPGEEVKNIALGIDVRGGQDFSGLQEVLDEMVQGGERMLDIGTGSGILTIGALKLGAKLCGNSDSEKAGRDMRERLAALQTRGMVSHLSSMLAHELKQPLAAIFNRCDVVIVAAGLDAALASVLGGLTSKPLFAVPTSVGYGIAEHGMTALRSMLASCAPGVCVLNIDNGYGAACAAARVLALLEAA